MNPKAEFEEMDLRQHYKGGIYRVVLRGVMSSEHGPNSYDESVVVYEHLWPHQRRFWFRKIGEFDSHVTLPDGKTVPRFRKITAEEAFHIMFEPEKL